MKRVCWLRFFLFFPIFAFLAETAYSSVSFTPPAGDYSMIYLANIFGTVDGVLNGTGSQMMGTMLAVFNSAVLAIGGVVIMYIIVVSTMNTAHEGEMLGHKWSSIWVPIRTVFGLSFLVPKVSGYSAMQIFVMWVIVQGVGVADNVWNAALNYLNRGGVIIQQASSTNPTTQTGGNDIASGAATILYGQICMAALQMQLENARTTYNDQANASDGTGSGPCYGNPSETMEEFCNTPVPDLINSVDPLNAQIQADASGNSPTVYSVTMPNLDTSSMYSFLNGICGFIQWNAVDTSSLETTTEVIDPTTGQCVIVNGECETQTTYTLNSMTSQDIEMVKLTRGMAVSQMYTSLATTSQLIVNNDPQINTNKTVESTNASLVAVSQFGVPLMGTALCTAGSSNCTTWGQDPTVSSSPTVLLQGDEYQGAIDDYNTMMSPTLKLMNDAANAEQANSARQFIQQAEQSGWIMAGSYFFNLVQLNGSSLPSDDVDQGSGLGASNFDTNTLTTVFAQSPCTGPYANLCTYFNGDSTPLYEIVYLIDGSGQTSVTKPTFTQTDLTYPVQSGTQASTAYGYVYNGLNLVLPGEPGTGGVDFNNFKIPKISLSYSFPKVNTSNSCQLKIKPFGCIWSTGKYLISPIVNGVLLPLANSFLSIATQFVNLLVNLILVKALTGFTYIFVQGVNILNTPGINPVVALAQMGITYINFAMNLWIAIAAATIGASILDAAFGIFGIKLGTAIFTVLMLLSPIFIGWISVMLGIAFITAYYIPFLPFMLFMFGSLGWLITVTEAMVAAPIVALGIAHPEGHDALGKSEQGLMILLNVFLRPAMMVIGYVAGIALSYVGVWLMNAGFQNVFNYMKGSSGWGSSPFPWAYIFGFFFTSLLYTTTYLTIVQKAFTLIAVLPDKVLRWVGGQAEQTGTETSQWAEEGKSQVKEGIDPTTSAASQITKQGTALFGSSMSKGKNDKGKGSIQ